MARNVSPALIAAKASITKGISYHTLEFIVGRNRTSVPRVKRVSNNPRGYCITSEFTVLKDLTNMSVATEVLKWLEILQTHLKIHYGERPHKCIYCSKGLNNPGNLKVHLKVHSEEKPYKCTQCHECFAHKCGISQHHKP